MAIFIAMPVFIYTHHVNLHAVRYDFLRDSMQRESLLVFDALLPFFKDLRPTSLKLLRDAVDRLHHDHRNVRIFHRSDSSDGSGDIVYVASSRRLPQEFQEQERADLIASGVLDSIPSSCRGSDPLEQFFTSVRGRAELLVSLTTYRNASHCWIILASYSPEAVPDAAQFDPTMTDQMSFFVQIYTVLMALAAVVALLLWDLWDSIRAFVREARDVRRRGPRPGGFSSLTRVPELAAMGQQLDQLADDLERSRQLIREAAEENAHALKTRIAIMEQSLEPIRRIIPPDQPNVARSLERIEKSVRRLDSLVAAARDLNWHIAASIGPKEERVDVGRILRRVLDRYKGLLDDRRIAFVDETPPGTFVAGDAALIDTIIESIVDNAAGIVPRNTTISAHAQITAAHVTLTIADEGPGVPEDRLEEIFQRYVSLRPQTKDVSDQFETTNFGIGLWIARRDAEAMNGGVTAKNRHPTGLEVSLRLPSFHD